MEVKLIITDVTRMKKPRVCVGAISEDWDSIRPVLPYPGIKESFLYMDNQEVIRPFSRITFDLIKPIVDPPHTEDWQFTPQIISYRGELTTSQRLSFLNKILDPSVKSIFSTEILNTNGSPYVQYGKGKRSLGTVKPERIESVRIFPFGKSISSCIVFCDQEGVKYRFSITDLSFQYYVSQYLSENHNDFTGISNIILEKLENSETFLRIGLGRAWAPDESSAQNRCYVFITGIYSFPDYLGGKCFADFDTKGIDMDYCDDGDMSF